MSTRLTLIAAVALLAATGCQDRNDTNQQPSTPAADSSPSAAGGTSPSNAAGVDRGQQQAQNDQGSNTAANGNGTMPSFVDLDMQHRGYLTEADVASNPGIAQRFKACDQDADGHLTKAEFDACKPNP